MLLGLVVLAGLSLLHRFDFEVSCFVAVVVVLLLGRVGERVLVPNHHFNSDNCFDLGFGFVETTVQALNGKQTVNRR